MSNYGNAVDKKTGNFHSILKGSTAWDKKQFSGVLILWFSYSENWMFDGC